jgi:integrase
LNGGRTLRIEQAVNRFGELAGLKTRAAKRDVDVCSDVATQIHEFIRGKSGLLFATSNGSPHLVGNLRTRWLQERFPDYGFHSFRRYRVTHLEAVRAHGHLTKVWTGHALSGVTEQYAESLKRNLTLRLAEVEKVGTGLALPAPSAPRISVSDVVQVAA